MHGDALGFAPWGFEVLRYRADLLACTIASAATGAIAFDIPPAQRDSLLSGQDEVDQTLSMAAAIGRFQLDAQRRRPWAYPAASAAA